MSNIASEITTFLLTGFVALCSALVVYITYSRFDTPAGWTFNGLTLLSVWLFVGHCWQGLGRNAEPGTTITYQEQPEGVWPPAPLIPEDKEAR